VGSFSLLLDPSIELESFQTVVAMTRRLESQSLYLQRGYFLPNWVQYSIGVGFYSESFAVDQFDLMLWS
jgi:hypothetical protein